MPSRKDPPDDAAAFDVAVVGAGPAATSPRSVAPSSGSGPCASTSGPTCADAPLSGGTCLNVGCIPSKALLDSSHHFHNLSHLFPGHGISVDGVRIDVAAMQARKDRVVASLGRGIAGLFGQERRRSRHRHGPPERRRRGGGRGLPAALLRPRHVVLATGSVPAAIEAAPTHGARIVDSEGALAFEETPRASRSSGPGPSVWSSGASGTGLVPRSCCSKRSKTSFPPRTGTSPSFRSGSCAVRASTSALASGSPGASRATKRWPSISRTRTEPTGSRWTASWSRSDAGPSPRSSASRRRASSVTTRVRAGGRVRPHEPRERLGDRRLHARAHARPPGLGGWGCGRGAHRGREQPDRPPHRAVGDLHPPGDRVGRPGPRPSSTRRASHGARGRSRSPPPGGRCDGRDARVRQGRLRRGHRRDPSGCTCSARRRRSSSPRR